MQRKLSFLSNLILLAIFAFVLGPNLDGYRTKAAGEVLLTVSPSVASVSPGSSFTVNILVNSNSNEVASIDFRSAYFEFDPTLVQVDSAAMGADVDPFLSSSGTINNITGRVTGIYGLPVDTVTYTFPAAGDFIFVTFNMTAKNAVSGTSYLRIYPAVNDIEIADLTFSPPYLNHLETNSSIIVGSGDTTSPIISETTPVSTPTNDNTPNYTFTSNEAGAISYAGDCSSATTAASVGANTITFNILADGLHSNCTIRVTDSAGNPSNLLAVTAFTIDTTAPEFSSVTPAASSSITNVTSSSGVGYTLDEAIASGTITITRAGGAADVSSPHTCDLAGTAKNSGAHTINLSDTTNGCAVAQTLVSGTIYTFAFDGVDVVGNPAIQVSRTDVTFDNIAPADITTLSVSSPTTSSLILTWASPGNDGTNGTAAGYDLRYLTSTITDSNWTSAAQASGEPAPQIAGTSQNMTVSGLSSGTTYYFAVKTTDAAGNQSGLSNTASGSTQSSGGGGGGGGGYIPTGPTNVSIIINNNAVSANSINVNLTLSAVNAAQMTISNNSDFSNSSWEPYNAAKTWILTSGNEAKTVYAKFKDSQGYSSQTVSDSIDLAITENSSPGYPDGTLLKSSLYSEIYVIKSGQKEWIKSVEEFNAGGYKWENIKVISQEELSSIPAYSGGGSIASNPSSYPEGTLLKTAESFKVYVIISGKKKWISTPEVFETLGYEWGNIKIVAKSDLDKVADYEDNLIRTIGDYKVYLVVNGIKRHIPNPEIFLNYGFSWGDVKDVSQSVVDKYQRAYLIRESRQGKIYYLDPRGIKKHIPSPEVFASYNNKWEDIQVISKKEMDSYSESNLIRLAGDDKVYLVENNAKRWIPTAGIFNKNGYNWNLIINVNKPEFDYYKKGADLK